MNMKTELSIFISIYIDRSQSERERDYSGIRHCPGELLEVLIVGRSHKPNERDGEGIL